MGHVVACDECNGTGKVTYDENHPIVKIFKFEPGTYDCPMCGGCGKAWWESPGIERDYHGQDKEG